MPDAVATDDVEAFADLVVGADVGDVGRRPGLFVTR
jgi:hypothetical protein